MPRYNLILAILSLAILAAPRAHAEDSDAARYQRCVLQVAQNAQAALEAARSWSREGGGAPASHCEALAFLALGHAADGAAILQELAYGSAELTDTLKADLFDEAGNAWLVAEEPARAVSAFSSAIDLASAGNLPASASATYYSDRARALILFGNRKAARGDLDRSIALAPSAAALTLRARIKRETKDWAGAANDIARALALDANFAEAFLERGRLGVLQGNIKAARQDFLKAAMLQKDGPITEEARREMEAMDVKVTN